MALPVLTHAIGNSVNFYQKKNAVDVFAFLLTFLPV